MASPSDEKSLREQRRVLRRLVPVWLVIGLVLLFFVDATFEKLFFLAFVPWIGWIVFGLAIFVLSVHNAYSFGRLGKFGRAIASVVALPLASVALIAAAPVLERSGERAVCCAHSSDDALIQTFTTNRSQFDQLVQMSELDSQVVRIAPDFTRLEHNWGWPRPDSLLGFSRNRWEQYRELFRTLHLSAGLEKETDGSIYLFATTRGMVTGGSTKGYAYSATPLAPTYSSLDEAPPNIRSNVPIYRHLSGPWYLFYSWDD